MNRAVLKSFLRSIADPALPDADVLARYRDGRDPEAFAELVARYGRLVWSVCKHRSRTEADAEDAFQATFLVFSQRAGSIRTGTALGAWLYGVASRVCSKAHRAAGRRHKRERANGVREATNDVAASAWDRALAAVHEEVETLPDSLRVPFVLCALEGRSPSDAAASLGWKLGTFSGRLTKAKDALIAKLDARGLTAGAVAAATVGVGLTNAPAAVVAKALAYASRESVVPQTILHLTQGVIAMNVTRVKVLAAAVLVACGLGSGVGSGWLANAQPPGPLPTQPASPKQVGDLYQKALLGLQSQDRLEKPKADAPKSKWEYQFLTRPVGYAPSIEKFQTTIKAVENDGGWEYVGLVNTKEGPDRETLPTLVFRRPVRVEASLADKVARAYEGKLSLDTMDYQGIYKSAAQTLGEKNNKIAGLEGERAQGKGDTSKDGIPDAKTAHQQVIDQLSRLYQQNAVKDNKIYELQSELAKLKGSASKDETKLTIAQKDLPLGVSELQDVLLRVASKNGNVTLNIMVADENGGTLKISGPKDSVEWARQTIEVLGGKTDSIRR